jgi:hypothetical protein
VTGEVAPCGAHAKAPVTALRAPVLAVASTMPHDRLSLSGIGLWQHFRSKLFAPAAGGRQGRGLRPPGVVRTDCASPRRPGAPCRRPLPPHGAAGTFRDYYAPHQQNCAGCQCARVYRITTSASIEPGLRLPPGASGTSACPPHNPAAYDGK